MKIHNKLTKVQSELKVSKNHNNSFGNYKYRNCEDILEAVKPLLLENDLSLRITDEIVNIGDRFYVKATVILIYTDKTDNAHEVIEVSAFAREAEIKKGMDASQITGASSSYARKYALNGLFLIDDTKDADSKDNSKSGFKATRQIEDANPTKAEIKKLCDELDPILSSADDYKKFIKEKTKLELSTDNYKEIISRLEALVEENK